MQGTIPPYALDTFSFRFSALAACAGRAPLGGDRDLTLGVLIAARLAEALLPPIQLEAAAAGGRAERAKLWLSGLTMPQPARMTLIRGFDATAVGPLNAAEMLAELSQIVTGHIDAPSQQELKNLVARLRLYYEDISVGRT